MSRTKMEVYTDGSCSPNPGPGGWGCYLTYRTEPNGILISWSQYDSKQKTTNNEMELMAIVKGLRLASVGSDVIIYADSQYGLGGIVAIPGSPGGTIIRSNKLGSTPVFTGWLAGWIKNGWKTAGNKPVKNKDVWQAIVGECARHLKGGSTLTFQWVKAHAGTEGNEMADRLANMGTACYK